jgi:hypothetical protein
MAFAPSSAQQIASFPALGYSSTNDEALIGRGRGERSFFDWRRRKRTGHSNLLKNIVWMYAPSPLFNLEFRWGLTGACVVGTRFTKAFEFKGV